MVIVNSCWLLRVWCCVWWRRLCLGLQCLRPPHMPATLPAQCSVPVLYLQAWRGKQVWHEDGQRVFKPTGKDIGPRSLSLLQQRYRVQWPRYGWTTPSGDIQPRVLCYVPSYSRMPLLFLWFKCPSLSFEEWNTCWDKQDWLDLWPQPLLESYQIEARTIPKFKPYDRLFRNSILLSTLFTWLVSWPYWHQ